MNTLWLDLETRSKTPLSGGVFRYVEDAEIQLVAWAWNDGPVEVEEWGGIDDWLRGIVAQADRVVCHNIEFDATLLEANGVHIPHAKRYCTMQQARRHGLPGGLDKLCDIYKIPTDLAKLKEGRQLMMMFCKPKPDGHFNEPADLPVQWARYKDYAKSDITSMRLLHKLMPTWNDELERPIVELDAKINERGFLVDVPFARIAVTSLRASVSKLNEDMDDASEGWVEKGTQVKRLMEHLLAEHGVSLPDLSKSTLERRLNDPMLPDAVRELIALRMESAKTSTSKYQTLISSVNADHRMRGTFSYCGAGRTHRWAGQRFQPHNLPSRGLISAGEIDDGIRALKAGCYDLVGSANLPTLASSALRGVVIPPPGKRLLVGDLANIEGRIGAWIAGEGWKLQAFRDYDSGIGPDLYRLSYARAFGIEHERVDPHQRQIGKVQELMLQYGGGVAAYVTGADTYGIDLADMADRAWPLIPRDLQIEAEKAFWWAQEQKRTLGLPHPVYCACDALKRLWRRANPAIEAMWGQLEEAAKATIAGREHEPIGAGLVSFSRVGTWLRFHMPNGTCLCYPSAKIVDGEITFMGQNPYTRTWSRMSTWGGTLMENACQKIARDVLCEGMLVAESAGMEIVLHVHDEIVAEADERWGAKDLIRAMTGGAHWTSGLPLAAKAFETFRYRKAD